MARSLSFSGRRRVRKVFGKIPEVIKIPNLIEVQKASYDRFLLLNENKDERENIGLQSALSSIFPIENFAGTAKLEFVSYDFDPPKYDV